MPHVFLQLHPRDMSQLIASHWSAIFWNNDDNIPSGYNDNTPEQNANVDPPPGLPQQPDNNQNDDNNPEPFNTLPSSPQSPDVPMPDDPHTPNHGLPPDDDDDDPFHTPFQLPPRPNDDSPDEEMHSPQDEPPDLPPYPSSPPDHPQPQFHGAQAIPVAPDTVIVPKH